MTNALLVSNILDYMSCQFCCIIGPAGSSINKPIRPNYCTNTQGSKFLFKSYTSKEEKHSHQRQSQLATS